MKLYLAGMFNSVNPIYSHVVAEDEAEAIQKIGKKLNLSYLPHEAREVEVDGFNIIVEPNKVDKKLKKDT